MPGPDATIPIQVDRVLAGRYRLIRPIAKGGMAEVWEGHDEVLSRPVAVKVLQAHLATDSTFVERFRREAISAARLTHPGVVATFDTGTDAGTAWIVMELVRGRTLRQLLNERGPMDPALAAAVAGQIADALAHAHRAGLVHRDVKPANVLLVEEDGHIPRAKVTDFGIAKASEGLGLDLTRTGMVLGTPKYLSPEQVEGREPDARADLYSLGVVLFEMLAGRPPFEGPTDMATAIAHVRQPAPRVSSFRDGIPAALDQVVADLLAKDPDARIPTAVALRRTLDALPPRGRAPAAGAPPGAVPSGAVSSGAVPSGAVSSGALPAAGPQSPATGSPGPVPSGAVPAAGPQSPATRSPATPSPDALSPGALSPGALSPGALSPGALSPGAPSSGSPTSGSPTSESPTGGTWADGPGAPRRSGASTPLGGAIVPRPSPPRAPAATDTVTNAVSGGVGRSTPSPRPPTSSDGASSTRRSVAARATAETPVTTASAITRGERIRDERTLGERTRDGGAAPTRVQAAAPPTEWSPPPPPGPAAGVPPTVARRPRRRWGPGLFVGALVVAGAVVAGVLLAGGGRPSIGTGSSATPSALKITGVTVWMMNGRTPDNPTQTPLSFDGNPATAWSTDRYATPTFGGYYSGIGLAIHVEGSHTLHELTVTSTTIGWSAQSYTAASLPASGQAVTAWGDPTATHTAISGSASFGLNDTSGSYVLLWLTNLGPARQAGVAELTVS